ncbi:MAG: cation:proton antiporter [Actinomycetota bacterium]
MVQDDFALFAAVLAVAAAVGLLAVRLRQPLVVAFILVGILVGPVGLGWVAPDAGIAILAQLGIAVLLFLVGLKLDFHLIRQTGAVALATGLGQVTFTCAIGFLLSIGLGMEPVTALYVAIALTFSSTIIIVKLLSDKRELDELHGRIAIGFLIVQDLVVVLVMMGLTAFAEGGDNLAIQGARTVAVGGGLLLATGVAARWVLPALLPFVARSSELLVLFALAWAVALAAASDALGFSSEVGAFLAGVALASTPYREAVGARLVSLRDFLLLFFFLDLGARLEFAAASEQLFEAAVLSAFVLIGNPLIVLAIMGVMGYRARTSFLAGLTVAQISEFSLILAALGLSLGHIDAAAVSLVTVVGLITIGASTYMILSSKQLYERLAPLLRVFERSSPTKPTSQTEQEPVDMVLFGLGRIGASFVDTIVQAGYRVLAVDFDPQAVRRWEERGVRTLFGDASDHHLLSAIPLSNTTLVASTLPSADENLPLLHGLRGEGYQGKIALVARNEAEARRYASEGVDLVVEPAVLAGAELIQLLGATDQLDSTRS